MKTPPQGYVIGRHILNTNIIWENESVSYDGV